MKISTKGRYALRVMVDLALNYNGEYIPLKDIAQRQGISIKYIEQIIALLNKAGLIMSNKGKIGGYKLVKSPEKYNIGDILRATEGDLTPLKCIVDDNICDKKKTCKTYSFWVGLNDVIVKYINSKTLSDLIK